MSLTPLAYAKSIARLTGTSNDDQLQLLLDGVEEWAALYCGVYLSPTSPLPEVALEAIDGGVGRLIPARLPISSVAGVWDAEDVADDEDAEAISPLLYTVRERGLRLRDGDDWEEGLGRWLVTYTGGYTATTLPPGFQGVVCQLFKKAWAAAGDLSSEGAVGATTAYHSLAAGDILTQLDAYVLGRKL